MRWWDAGGVFGLMGGFVLALFWVWFFGAPWCAEVDPHGLEARVTGEPLAQHEAAVADGAEDVRTLRAVIYTYWARCAPGWCWRAARVCEVAKCSGKWRKIIFKIRILCFGALRAKALT